MSAVSVEVIRMGESKAAMAILAKTRAMYGRRIKPEEYRELLHKKSVSEVAGYLKNETGYATTLSGIQEALIHRGQLELLLERHHMENYLRLARFYNTQSQGIYQYVRLKYEVDIVLAAVRYFDVGSMEKLFDQVPGFLLDRLSLDVAELSKAQNIREVLFLLKGTPYAKLLEPYADNESGHFRLGWCETALYGYYYDTIFDLIRKSYKGEAKKRLQAIFSAEVENLNNKSCYRMKRYFQMEPESIRNHLLLKHDRRSKALLEEIITARTPESLLEILGRNRPLPESAEKEEDVYLDIEHIERQDFLRLCRSAIRMSTSPVVSFVAYVELSALEVENLINIIEGIRYAVPETEIESLLVI